MAFEPKSVGSFPMKPYVPRVSRPFPERHTRGGAPGVGMRGAGAHEPIRTAGQRDRTPDPWEPLLAALPRFDGQASCATVDPDMWMADPGDPANASRQEAIAVCQACEIRQQCLDYALEHKIQDGIWGGATALERALVTGRRKGWKYAATAAVEQRLSEVLAYLETDTREGRFDRCAESLGLSGKAVAAAYRQHARQASREQKPSAWDLGAARRMVD